jgi:3-phytase
VANTTQQALIGYIIDPATLEFRRAGFPNVSSPSFSPNSVALYVSPVTGRVFAFAGSATGLVVQFELTAETDGGTTSNVVRSFDVGNAVVGLAVDDSQGKLYVAEQGVGIWEYGAEPDAADARVSVDTVTGGGGGLVQPLGGVALYRASGVRGYLLAVSGGDNAVRIYERQSGAHTFRGSFTVISDGGIDAVEAPREVVVTNRSLGALFPLGLVAVHDSANPGTNENFKLVPWPAIATGFTSQLVVDTSPGDTSDGGTADGGTTDGGTTDGGSTGPIGNVPPPGPLPESPEGGVKTGQNCVCASTSVPGSVLLALLGVLLLSRRRPGA